MRVRQGDDVFWLGKGTLKTALQGAFTVEEEVAGSDARRLALHGPVRRRCRRSATAFARGRATSTGSSPGTRSARTRARASSTSRPGCGAEDYQLGKALGLPVIGPIDEDGRYLAGLRLADRARGARRSPSGSSTTSSGAGSSTTSSRTPTATRTAGGAARRCCSGSSTSGSSRWARSTTSRASSSRRSRSTASLRYQIMEVVDGIRWIPDFGYERELDWLRNMHDWMISKKRYWGLALPIYDCDGVRDGRGHRRARGAAASGRSRAGTRSRATRRTGRGSTRSGSPARRCGEPVERIKDVGNPWLDAGIVPFSTLHFREDPEYWAKWFPADFITESFPGQFRNWFYSMLAMSTVLKRTRAVQDDLRLRPRCSARTGARCTRAGATRSSSTRRPTGWASTSCAGCSPRRGPRTTSCSAGTRPTRRGASCWCCGTCTRSS